MTDNRPGGSPPTRLSERGLRGWLRRWLRVPDAGPLAEFSIAKLELRPGDLLVLKCDRRIPEQQYQAIASQIKATVPAGVKAIILEPGMTFEAIRRNDGAAA